MRVQVECVRCAKTAMSKYVRAPDGWGIFSVYFRLVGRLPYMFEGDERVSEGGTQGIGRKAVEVMMCPACLRDPSVVEAFKLKVDFPPPGRRKIELEGANAGA